MGGGEGTTEGETAGARLVICGELSNLDIIAAYFEPDESATFFMIALGSKSASFRAVI